MKRTRRAVIPVFPWIRSGLDICRDEIRHGLWVWCIAVGIETDERPGFALSLRWGWVEKSTTVVHKGWL